MVLAAVRSAGVPMQRIRPALEALSRELGLDHTLASRRLYTDGAELLFDYASASSDPDAGVARDLVVVRKGQADPTRSFGQPIFAHGGARIADVLGRFWAGEELAVVADDYGVPLAELEDVIRVASRRAA